VTDTPAITVVLVEPQNPGNVGMVCRAMKNMGFSELRLVNPCDYTHAEAYKFAVSARDLLDNVSVFPTLADAIADCEITVATTRRHGKYRREIFSPDEIAGKIKKSMGCSRAALVFGREDSGLSTEELSQCRWSATIPTANEYGSLNLAQAVLIFCYALHTASADLAVATRTLADSADLEALYAQMERTLLRIGFLNPENPAHIMRTMRRIFARADLDHREVAVLRGMMSQIDWAASDFKGKKGA
jgi:tRNA/rRNA methyltransferase